MKVTAYLQGLPCLRDLRLVFNQLWPVSHILHTRHLRSSMSDGEGHGYLIILNDAVETHTNQWEAFGLQE